MSGAAVRDVERVLAVLAEVARLVVVEEKPHFVRQTPAQMS
jgi:hypothetical protein